MRVSPASQWIGPFTHRSVVFGDEGYESFCIKDCWRSRIMLRSARPSHQSPLKDIWRGHLPSRSEKPLTSAHQISHQLPGSNLSSRGSGFGQRASDVVESRFLFSCHGSSGAPSGGGFASDVDGISGGLAFPFDDVRVECALLASLVIHLADR